MKKVKNIFVIIVLLSGYFFSHNQLTIERDKIIKKDFIDYTMPSVFVEPISLEFKGLVSDFLMFKFMTFIGGQVHNMRDYDNKYWDYTVQTLDAITDLDPYFFDPYLFAEMFLTVNAPKYDDANNLLLKAREHIKDDYRIPYYLGFNYHYYLKDDATAAKYFIEASKIAPPSHYYLASLAARLSLYSDNHKLGIKFLEDMLKITTIPRAKVEFRQRIEALKSMELLDQKVEVFKSTYKKNPTSLSELVDTGIIEKIPEEPYGGKFILLPNGRVYTDTNMLQRNKTQ